MAWGAMSDPSLSPGLLTWLLQSALMSSVILVLGTIGLLLSWQPVRRARIIELTLLGCLVVPWLAIVPGYPQWGMQSFLDVAESLSARHEPRVHPVVSTVPAASPSTMARHGVSFASLVLGLYAGGVVAGAAWWLLGIASLARVLHKSRPAPAKCHELFHAVAGSERRRVRLLVHPRLAQPLAAAWGRPVIVLPEALCDDEQAVRWSLAHEWSHVERRDFRMWMVAGLARVVFFYHPLVWWLRWQLRVCQDYLADAAAARQTGQPEDYAEFLTVRATAGSLHPATVGLGMGFRKSDLYRRVVMLVEKPPLERRMPRFWNASVSLAVLVLVVALPAFLNAPESAAQAKAMARPWKQSPTKKVPFVIGPKKFAKGDDIVIHEVWSECGSLAKGDTVTVKGTCTLVSRPAAVLLFSITQDGRNGLQPGYALKRPARAGSEPFELELPITVDGHLHMAVYDLQTNRSFGNLYFGTSPQMNEISHWNLENW